MIDGVDARTGNRKQGQDILLCEGTARRLCHQLIIKFIIHIPVFSSFLVLSLI